MVSWWVCEVDCILCHYIKNILSNILAAQFSQFEIAFWASTGCLCSFILPAGRHAMLFKCSNMYARTDHSNTK